MDITKKVKVYKKGKFEKEVTVSYQPIEDINLEESKVILDYITKLENFRLSVNMSLFNVLEYLKYSNRLNDSYEEEQQNIKLVDEYRNKIKEITKKIQTSMEEANRLDKDLNLSDSYMDMYEYYKENDEKKLNYYISEDIYDPHTAYANAVNIYNLCIPVYTRDNISLSIDNCHALLDKFSDIGFIQNTHSLDIASVMNEKDGYLNIKRTIEEILYFLCHTSFENKTEYRKINEMIKKTNASIDKGVTLNNYMNYVSHAKK